MQASNTRRPLTALVLVAGAALVIGLPTAQAHSEGMEKMQMGGGVHRQLYTEAFGFGAPATATQAARTVNIAMSDMSFQPTEVTVRTGETVRFVVTNASGIDHEFTLGDAVTEQAHRKEMRDMMEMGEGMEHDDPNAITVKAGATRELTWRFSGGGQLEYDCNVPGHYEAGMKGLISVR